MLIKFTASNFLSFKEETEFDMLTREIRRHPKHVFPFRKVEVLKSAVIYGANGAGKSNLLMAIAALSNAVVEENIDIFNESVSFRLADLDDQPSKLEVRFVVDGVGYAYGIRFLDAIIIEEWLLLLNYGRKEDEVIFERRAEKGKEKLRLAPKYMKNQKDRLLLEVYEENLLEPTKPFLSLVKDKKFLEITQAYKWLEKGIVSIFPRMEYAGLVYNFINDQAFKDFTNTFIHTLDTGIDQLDIQTIDFDAYFGEDNTSEKERILKSIRQGEPERVGDNRNALAMMENGFPVIKKAVSYHTSRNGKRAKFELFEESDGTLRLIDFIPVLYLLENFPVTILIDEIDQSIHPTLLKEFIAKIQSNPNKLGQLIFTTHESNLLDLDLFRQDEIWFAQKTDEGATQFYPLSDFNPRPDLDVRKGYLTGKFGAIPFLADLKELKWDGQEIKS